MSNATSPNVDEFRRSLEQLVQQAQQTAQLGLAVAREQVETFVRNPAVPTMPNMNVPGDMNAQLDEVRRNLQNMARDIETKAQEIVHLASTYVQQAPNPFQPPRAGGSQTEVKVEPPSASESATAAGAGTAQNGSNMGESTPTASGEAPQQ